MAAIYDFTCCPECQAPAEVVDRYEQESTSGPVALVATACVRRHHITVEETRHA